MFTFSGHDVIKPLRLSPLVCYYSIRIISKIKNIPLKYEITKKNHVLVNINSFFGVTFRIASHSNRQLRLVYQ